MRRTVVLFLSAYAMTLAAVLASGCSDKKIPAPASDKNFDDPDEPATPGGVGAADATTADGAPTHCASDVDCPPKARRCFFAIQDGCGAVGTCVNFVEQTNCPKARFCDCSGSGVTACAPEGLSPVPVQTGATCEEPDAAPPSDGAADSSPDAPHDAPHDVGAG